MKKSVSKLLKNENAQQFARFCIVGVIAAGIHYLVYCLMQMIHDGSLWLSIAYTIGYVVSLVCNFFMTTYFTFRSKVTVGKAAGFSGSHLINYTLHIVLFNLFICLGVHRLITPILVLMIAVPTNFTILHFVYRKK
ncbi:MAG: GtrA family protein [Prevotella sp.]|nr:GtrA family protein [Prevotella sp.]